MLVERRILEYMKQIATDMVRKEYAEIQRLAEDRRGWRVGSNHSWD